MGGAAAQGAPLLLPPPPPPGPAAAPRFLPCAAAACWRLRRVPAACSGCLSRQARVLPLIAVATAGHPRLRRSITPAATAIMSSTPQVRPVAEDEMFKVLRTGKRKKKEWKRMVTKVRGRCRGRRRAGGCSHPRDGCRGGAGQAAGAGCSTGSGRGARRPAGLPARRPTSPSHACCRAPTRSPPPPPRAGHLCAARLHAQAAQVRALHPAHRPAHVQGARHAPGAQGHLPGGPRARSSAASGPLHARAARRRPAGRARPRRARLPSAPAPPPPCPLTPRRRARRPTPSRASWRSSA